MAHQAKNPAIAMREGVSPSCLALPRLRRPPWPTVFAHLVERLPLIGPQEWLHRMENGAVLDESGEPVSPQAPFAPGARIYYWRELPHEAPIPFEERIVFEDDLLVVADKPHFLPVTPGGRYVRETLLVRLKNRLNCPNLSPLHRIDRETAGLVVLSKRPQDRDAYQKLFRQQQIHKTYLAIASAPPQGLSLPIDRRSRIAEDPERFYRMQEIEGPPNSHTHIRLLQCSGARGLYQLEPLSGKRHQLRVHMCSLGLPLEGDQFYPQVRRGPHQAEDYQQPLQLLARSLSFKDPVSAQEREFVSSLGLRWAEGSVRQVSPTE
jgi:tRNA pseudouridine32 synthase/23S rRNA pseudouridine746 synthase